MSTRRWTLPATLAFLGLPVAVVPIEAVRFRAANHDTGSFVSSGVVREYLLHVPARLDRTRPVPLVLSLHGAGLWGAAQRDMSQWNRVADREGFVVVYPSGAGGRGLRVWHEGPRPGESRDVTFLAALIDTIASHYAIDPARIYVNGLSNGGGMSFALACALPDRIAAVGLVASAQFRPVAWCANGRAVPMINFHGTTDPDAPYLGGTSWLVPEGMRFQNQPRFVADWARRNECSGGPTDSTIAPDVVRRAYTNCANDADVVFYRIEGGGHTWPGGGPMPEWFTGRTTHSVNASELMWAFFREHPLRPRR